MKLITECPKCKGFLTPICAGYICNKCKSVINYDGTIVKDDGSNFYAKPKEIIQGYENYVKMQKEKIE